MVAKRFKKPQDAFRATNFLVPYCSSTGDLLLLRRDLDPPGGCQQKMIFLVDEVDEVREWKDVVDEVRE